MSENTENIAVIDLGTNTFHLLIVAPQPTGTFEILHKSRQAVKIGEGGIDLNIIKEEAAERALKALHSFRQTMDEFGVERVVATATSAFRNASNGQLLADRIESETGIQIQIISGMLEAQLIYEGVRRAVRMPEEKCLIMDIGGGSVEYILCDHERVYWKHSFEVGGQRLMNKFHQKDPIPTESLQGLYKYLHEKLHLLNVAIAVHNPRILIGASGTFDTLCEIYHKRNNMVFVLENQSEYRLPVGDFRAINSDIVKRDREGRLQIPGMIEMRADMIVVACALIDYVANQFNIESIWSSTYALKEGLLFRMMKSQENALLREE